MYNLLSKNGLLYAFFLGLAVILLFLIPVFTGLDSFNQLGEDMKGSTGIFDTGLWLTILLVIVAAVAIVVFSLLSIVNNPKGSLRGLMALAALVILFIVGYAMTTEPASGSKLSALVTEFNVNLSAQKIINGALTLGIGMTVLTALTFVFSEIRNVLK